MEIKKTETKSLDIQDIIEAPLEDLITNAALSGSKVMWIDGMIILFSGFGTTEAIIHQQLEGIYHWNMVEYSFSKNYEPFIKAEKLNSQVPVYNMSYIPFYQEIAKFIIEFREHK